MAGKPSYMYVLTRGVGQLGMVEVWRCSHFMQYAACETDFGGSSSVEDCYGLVFNGWIMWFKLCVSNRITYSDSNAGSFYDKNHSCNDFIGSQYVLFTLIVDSSLLAVYVGNAYYSAVLVTGCHATAPVFRQYGMLLGNGIKDQGGCVMIYKSMKPTEGVLATTH